MRERILHGRAWLRVVWSARMHCPEPAPLTNEHANLMLMLSRRLQVLIDDERYAALERDAARTNSSVSAVVRAAIDVRLVPAAAHRSGAGRRLLDAPRRPWASQTSWKWRSRLCPTGVLTRDEVLRRQQRLPLRIECRASLPRTVPLVGRARGRGTATARGQRRARTGDPVGPRASSRRSPPGAAGRSRRRGAVRPASAGNTRPRGSHGALSEPCHRHTA